MKKAIQIDGRDNVATLTSDARSGEKFEVLGSGGEVILRTRPTEDIGFGHKIALKQLHEGDEIIKYGELIGLASKPIETGAWIHTHNVESVRLPTESVEGER